MGEYRRRLGDRYDGRLLRKIDPFYRIIPYIMGSRTDAQNYFEDKIEIDHVEKFIRQKRRESGNNITFLHVVLAALVRTMSQKPGLNRFVAGQKIYARNEILISLALKKQLREDSPETTVKLKFKPADTLYDVIPVVNAAVEENKREETNNDTDKAARIFMMCPGLFVKFLLWMVKTLDYFGILPKVLNRVSPFHTSVFVTDLGSLGIQPVYHHIYNIGTTSVFMAFGVKRKERFINRDGIVTEKRYVDLKITTDERIADGYYFASAFRYFRNLVQHPEKLETPPEHVVEDAE